MLGSPGTAVLLEEHRLDLAVEISLVVRDLGELHVLARVYRSTGGREACEQRSERLGANRHRTHATLLTQEFAARCATVRKGPWRLVRLRTPLRRFGVHRFVRSYVSPY